MWRRTLSLAAAAAGAVLVSGRRTTMSRSQVIILSRFWSSQSHADGRGSAVSSAVAELLSETNPSFGALLNLDLSTEAVPSVVAGLETETALRFCEWFSQAEEAKLNPKWCNVILQALASGGKGEEFWGLVEMMRKKGYGVWKTTLLHASEKFGELCSDKDAASWKDMCLRISHDNMVARKSGEIWKILQSEEKQDIIFTKITELNLAISSDLVVAVLERAEHYPEKAKTFFQWAERFAGYDVDSTVYNTMARIVAREDFVELFWDMLTALRNRSFVLERETYLKALNGFLSRKMVGDAVKLFVFAMLGEEKPGDADFLFLLKKIVVRGEIDLSLVTETVRAYVEGGNTIKGSVLGGMFNSLKSVGKLGEIYNVFKAMEEGGFVPDSFAHGQVVLGICHDRVEEAADYLDQVEESGYLLDQLVWAAVVRKLYLSGNRDKTLKLFSKLLVKKRGKDIGITLDAMVRSIAKKDGAKDAYKFLHRMASEKSVKPLHETYKFTIEWLLSQGNVGEGFYLLGLMKTDGFPPFIDPFIHYISKHGSADDAVGLLNAMTSKKYPSRSVYLRLFRALFEEERHEVMQGLLSRSPASVRNHADVLELFYIMKQRKSGTTGRQHEDSENSPRPEKSAANIPNLEEPSAAAL